MYTGLYGSHRDQWRLKGCHYVLKVCARQILGVGDGDRLDHPNHQHHGHGHGLQDGQHLRDRTQRHQLTAITGCLLTQTCTRAEGRVTIWAWSSSVRPSSSSSPSSPHSSSSSVGLQRKHNQVENVASLFHVYLFYNLIKIGKRFQKMFRE